MKRGTLGILALVAIVVIAFMSYIGSKNTMVAKHNDVQTQFSNIDTQLQRRADLIPNLVSTVKGYAKHEETVFGDIANARAGLLNARDPQSKIAANNQLDGAIGRLLALSESYPDLKSNQNFLALQDQLEGTENRIAVERRRYNDTLRDYNTYIQQFPASLWAGFAGFHTDNDYFQADQGSRTAPKVTF
ncbi:LemA family protein [Acidipila sp. EB88]|uniref:LemA family protein n=1 Tax=Acidipila sp. EB88 TaxID=2305226 RepID=UPI000F5E9D08|nr:LemA family protein [Acidipila sp. EB88]RRA49787.1 LemA family protein [Acidipila sp. EB88]